MHEDRDEVRVVIWLERDVLERVKAIAEHERRAVSRQIEVIVRDAVRFVHDEGGEEPMGVDRG